MTKTEKSQNGTKAISIANRLLQERVPDGSLARARPRIAIDTPVSAIDTGLMTLNPKPRFTQVDTPPQGRKVIPIRQVRKDERLSLIVCGTKLYGMYVHWLGKTQPHTEPKTKCDGCVREAPMRWYGWLHCCSPEQLTSFFLELTPISAQNALDAMGGEVVRGSKLLCFREGSKLRAPVLIEKLADYDCSRGAPPQPANPSATLTKIWNKIVVLED